MDLLEEIKARRSEDWRADLRKSLKNKERMALEQNPMPMRAFELELSALYIEDKLGFSEEEALAEARRCLDCPNAGCVQACPTNIQIPSFIKNIERGNLAEAWQTLRQSSTLSAICSRVCAQYKQCEGGCIYNVSLKKRSVSIGALERYVATYEANHRQEIHSLAEPLAPNGLAVAIIGGGPAGLAAAHDLALWGYQVDVYEAENFLGGVMRTGIPRFRLPASIIDDEVERLKLYGVNFILNTKIGVDVSYDELKSKKNYSAFFLGTGAGAYRKMGIEGEELNGIMLASDYLYQTNLAEPSQATETLSNLMAKRVAVIGGGNTAMDVIRTAIRLDAEEAILIYRRSQEEMPASIIEINEALEEGAIFKTLYNPVRYYGDENGQVISMDVERMALGEPDESGRRSPVSTGEITNMPIDLVVLSIGSSPESTMAKFIPNIKTSWGNAIAVDETQASSVPFVYSGGDLSRGGSTVVHAMRDGRQAARSIHQLLCQEKKL